MHGDVAYCRKHGHDWQILSEEFEHDMMMTHVECRRCGLNHILASFFEEDDE